MQAGKVFLMAVGAVAIVLILGFGIAGRDDAHGATPQMSEMSTPEFMKGTGIYTIFDLTNPVFRLKKKGQRSYVVVMEMGPQGWLRVGVPVDNKPELSPCWWHPEKSPDIAICFGEFKQ